MPLSKPTSEDWIHETVRALRQQGSWTGRIHVHKLLYMLEALGQAEVPFQFELYHYGPYARDLDEKIACMEAFGSLERDYPRSGYGPQYGVIEEGEISRLPDQELYVVRAMAEQFGRKNSSELELIATCIWVERSEGIISDNDIVDRVSEVKPKYSRDQIEQQLAVAREIARNVNR